MEARELIDKCIELGGKEEHERSMKLAERTRDFAIKNKDGLSMALSILLSTRSADESMSNETLFLLFEFYSTTQFLSHEVKTLNEKIADLELQNQNLRNLI
jgi:endonuclease III